MHAPVDEGAAAGDGLGGEGAAQSGDGTVRAEADVDVKHLAQLAGLYVFLDPVDAVVEPVDDADVENLSRFMLHPLHLQGFLIGAGSGLFTQHMLAGP